MTVILKEPPNTSTLIPRPLGSVILTCFTLAAGFAGCIDNPDPQSVITRTSYLNEAPKAIQDLAKAIDGKNRGQIQGIILDKYGPSRHTGSGVDIEVWDVAGGNLMLHPLVGPSFTPKGGKRIWLLTTTNRALPNILGSFEMSSLPDPKGMQNWLGEVRLRSDRTYRFKDSQGVRDPLTTQTDNFFKRYPSGAFEIEFAAGCTGETILESLPDNSVLCRLVFTPKGGGQTITYSIVADDRKLRFRSDQTPTFDMDRFWREFWR